MNADRLTEKWIQWKDEQLQKWGKFRDEYLVQYEGDDDNRIGTAREPYRYKDEHVRRTDQENPQSRPITIGEVNAQTEAESQSSITKDLHITNKEHNMTTRYLTTIGVALVLGAALIAGPATAANTGGEKTPINDSWITAKTKIALAADGRVKGRQIDVVTTNSVVMLRGKVDSDSAKQAAEEITKMLDGVKTVKNDLVVVAPSKRDAVEEKDEAITARVQKKLAKNAHLKKANITVQTNAGVVSLTGEVKDLMTSANASWTVWFVPGVKTVKNDLTVKEKV